MLRQAIGWLLARNPDARAACCPAACGCSFRRVASFLDALPSGLARDRLADELVDALARGGEVRGLELHGRDARRGRPVASIHVAGAGVELRATADRSR
jgi:hypothetical protein